METLEAPPEVKNETPADPMTERIRQYWDSHIHDIDVTTNEVGTRGFFDDLANYRFEKLDYLPRMVDFSGYRDQDVLEVGCGIGIDLVKFAQGGARVTGIDLADQSIRLAKQNFEQHGVWGDLRVMDGEHLEFEDSRFDMVYAHGVLQYSAHAERMMNEIHRVLKPGGQAIMMFYSKYSWLNFMAVTMGIGLEHADAPILRKFSIPEVKKALARFANVRVVPERFPVKTRLHRGIGGKVFNLLFVPAFNLVPRPLVRWSGWHIMVFATK